MNLYPEKSRQEALLKLAPQVGILLIFLSVFFYISASNTAQKNADRILGEGLERIYLTGKFSPGERDDFTLIPSEYIVGANNPVSSNYQSKMYLRNETLYAYLTMRQAALADGVNLKIASGTRNFRYQRELWDKKWSGSTILDGQNILLMVPLEPNRFNKILEYLAVPGTSRHHWGTDIDLNGANPAYFETEEGKIVYDWLVVNAPRYGFCQTYNEVEKRAQPSYQEEKWHWSFLPLSRIFTSEYKRLIKPEDISGFAGDKFVNQNLIKNYVSSINPDCI